MNNNNDNDELKPPFPPRVNIEDFIRVDGLNAKAPNAFFVYRKSLTRHLLQLNHRLTMVEVSKLASAKWKSEPNTVKKAYKKLSREIDRALQHRRRVQFQARFADILTPSDITRLQTTPSEPVVDSTDSINVNLHDSECDFYYYINESFVEETWPPQI